MSFSAQKPPDPETTPSGTTITMKDFSTIPVGDVTVIVFGDEMIVKLGFLWPEFIRPHLCKMVSPL